MEMKNLPHQALTGHFEILISILNCQIITHQGKRIQFFVFIHRLPSLRPRLFRPVISSVRTATAS